MRLSRRALLAAVVALPLAATQPARASERLLLRGGGQELPLGPRQVVSASPFEDEVGFWSVRVALTEEATADFAALTTALVGQTLEILFDGDVLMAPRVMEPITGGTFIVSGLSQIQARRLGAFLRS